MTGNELKVLSLLMLFVSGGCGAAFSMFRTAKYGAIISCIALVASVMLDGGAAISFQWFSINKMHLVLSFGFGSTETIISSIITAILCCLYFARKIECIDKAVNAKFGALNIFVGCMCVAVFSQNLFQFYVAVEAMGILSAVIVGLEKGAATNASRVFAFNKFASLLFLISLIIIALSAKSLEFVDIQKLYSGNCSGGLFWASALLVVSCLCKGAQVPFSYWLIAAAKANIFASILIHSGTIVGLGIIFITKCHFLFSPFPILQEVMIVSGIVTAILMAGYATVYNNIKEIMACLTASSIGSMFVACGLSMHTIAVLAFTCHALFKATLFLGFAYLIAATAGEKNILKMGGLKNEASKLSDIIWITFIMAVGIPLLPGFFAKVPFLASLQLTEMPLLVIANVVANMFATMALFRIIVVAMYGKSRMDDLTLSMVSNSNAYNMKPIWLVIAISIFGSFVAWSSCVSGKLHFGEAGVARVRDAFDYFLENVGEVCQIAASIIIVLLFMRFSRSKYVDAVLETFMKILMRNKFHKRFCGLCTLTMLKILRGFDEANVAIANILNVRSYRALRGAGIALSNAHRKLLAAQVIWIILGLALILAAAIRPLP
ncbi:MAG: hypothetical protein LBJ69_00390 [Holosporales bacterium]|jgi:NADH-quinone oxidoreductase subunit L|nr:hypothetical protein [Holosporales bacterium]